MKMESKGLPGLKHRLSKSTLLTYLSDIYNYYLIQILLIYPLILNLWLATMDRKNIKKLRKKQ